MSTASGLVFAGNNNGYLYALDSKRQGAMELPDRGFGLWHIAGYLYDRRRPMDRRQLGRDGDHLCAIGQPVRFVVTIRAV